MLTTEPTSGPTTGKTRGSGRFVHPLFRDPGSRLMVLTALGALAFPAYAGFPGGNGKIAFTSDRDGNDEIYVMDANGSNPIRLTNNTARDSDPAWSPAGTRIVFSSNRDGNDEIYVMDADGNNPLRLTTTTVSNTLPGWSPDGSRIVFTQDDGIKPRVYVMDADGANPTSLSDRPEEELEPAWSPAATRIAFTQFTFGDPEIWLMNTNGLNPTRLTSVPGADQRPDWSPDGAQVAFWSDRDGNAEIYVMNADGSLQANRSNNPATDQDPAWSPDSSRIAFTSNRDGNAEILTTDGFGNTTNLSQNPAADRTPDWQPVTPPNDARSQALVVGQGQFRGSLALATRDGSSTCDNGVTQPDIWFRYTAPMAGTLRASTCGTHDLGGLDSGTDTILALYSGDGLTQRACNDDWRTSPDPVACNSADAGVPFDSYAQSSMAAGEDVLIRVSKYSDTSPARIVLLNLGFVPDLAPDTDGDGVPDSLDNCRLLANANQRDTNGDGYGNLCDPDFNNNGVVDSQDGALLKVAFGSSAFPDRDLNGNGIVDSNDGARLKARFGQPPGPSGLVP